ncbi:hypothetical protein [Aeromicrobium sp.]|uniref:hypothetical protein n=1 Tax=Aeromicrobium sp. TaxID=1871063 RepID=UPI002FCC9926
MQITRGMRWAGSAALVGGLTAIVLTPPFATAYFLAYPGEDVLPFWFDSAEPRLDPLITFASREDVYATYGKIYNLAYVLFMPMVVALHRAHASSSSRLEKRGFVVLMAGLVATTVGVAGDYWGDGIGFALEVLGLLAVVVGVTIWGLALLRCRVVPRAWAWLLLVCGPGAFVSAGLIGHIPSGPTLSFAIAWLVVGCMLMLKPSDPTMWAS